MGTSSSYIITPARQHASTQKKAKGFLAIKRPSCVIDGSAPAALASLLFDPLGPQIIEKTQCFATFLPFRASELLSSDFPFFDLLSSSLLFSDFPTSAFPSVHIVGSLASKLPSAIYGVKQYIVTSVWPNANLKLNSEICYRQYASRLANGGAHANSSLNSKCQTIYLVKLYIISLSMTLI